MKNYNQNNPYTSPWSFSTKIKILLWQLAWPCLCAWTIKPMNTWRLFWLKFFGAKIHGTPFVHQRARIQFPWNLTLHDRACLGDRANAYSLDKIVIHAGATVAQEAYLCTGTHNFSHPALHLQTAPIQVGTNAFIGARAFVMPGINIGEKAVIGACSVVTRSIAAGEVVAGNPAKLIGRRE